MTPPLQRLTDFYASLPPQTVDALEAATVTRRYAKGDYLLREGAVCRQSFFILEGAVRKFRTSDTGAELTTDLYFADDFAIAFTSYALRQPSNEALQALAPVAAQSLDRERFDALKKEHPGLTELDLLITELHGVWVEQRLHQFRTLSGAERYAALLRDHPQMLREVALTHVASFLGVTLETLSRIRAGLRTAPR